MRLLIAKGLRGGRGRFAICVAGIAVSTLLVLVLLATYRSVVRGVTQFLGRPGLDLWVAPRGTDNLIRSSGVIPIDTLEQIASVRGVAHVEPILRSFVTAEANGRRITLLGIGFFGAGGRARPRFISGRAPKSPDEIALDRAAAYRLGVATGDIVAINRRRSVLAGVTTGTNLLATQFAFANLGPSPAARGVSFGAAELSDIRTAAQVERHLHERFPDLEIMSRPAFEANNVREIGSGFLPMLLLITVLGSMSAALLAAFLVNGVIEERRADLAVLLAAGARPATIAGGLTLHAASLLAGGIGAGTIAAYVLGRLMDRVAPVIPLEYSTADLGLVVVLLTASGLLTSVIPVFRLKDIDPLEAFRQ